MKAATCPCCGRSVDELNRHLRFALPEPVLSIPEAERAARTWADSDFMVVKDLGSFVRIRVPIHLTGGYTVTYGAWLSVHPDDLRRAWEVWDTPDYAHLTLSGFLANMLPGWEEETLAKPLEAIVQDADQTPVASASPDAFLRRVLQETWPHDAVLSAIAPYE